MTETITKNFIIDFDSTFTQVEALDVLCEITCREESDKQQALKEIEEITNLAMGGELSFRESLERRLNILKAHKDDIPLLIERLKKEVSKSFVRIKISSSRIVKTSTSYQTVSKNSYTLS